MDQYSREEARLLQQKIVEECFKDIDPEVEDNFDIAAAIDMWAKLQKVQNEADRIEAENKEKSKFDKAVEVLKIVAPIMVATIGLAGTILILSQNTAIFSAILEQEQTGMFTSKAFMKWMPFKVI